MNKTEYEQKRFRYNFLFLLLSAAVGILIAVYLYDYAKIFDNEYSLPTTGTGFDGIKELLLLFYDELKISVMIFLFGFTVFSGIVDTVCVGYKGFLFGLTVKITYNAYHTEAISQKYFILLTATGALILFSHIIIASKALCYSSQIRYTGSDIRAVMSNRLTKNYIVLFLLYTVIICICTALRQYLTFI